MEDMNTVQPDRRRPAVGEEIDLAALLKKLWDGRKLIYKSCGVAVVAALVVGFSIPKEYTASAILAPETSGAQMSGSISALAGMMGLNMGNSGRDAVSPTLYPDVVSSVPFITDLFSLEVTDRKEELTTTLYDYLENHNRMPWWSHVIGAPFKALGWCISQIAGSPEETEEEIDPYRLTRDQMRIVKALGERIYVVVDKKTSVITLSVTMQDPVIAATVAEQVIENLTRHITAYRTSKARHDLEFAEKLFDETRESYEQAQSRYAEYVDRNQNIVLQKVRIEQERLQNEMNLAYSVYNQTAQQLQLARAKVQESTPVYAVVNPVTVPLRPSRPSKIMILIGFLFLACAGSGGWILFGRDIMDKLKSGKPANE